MCGNRPHIWRIIPNWEDYSVSCSGKVKQNNNSPRNPQRLCKLQMDDYVSAYLEKNRRQYKVKVHGLVMLAFVGPRPVGMEVNHKDANKHNNFLSNLEYVTPSENMQHAHANGLMVSYAGSENPFSKLNEIKVRKIRRLYGTGRYTQKILGEKFGVSQGTVGKIVNGTAWRAEYCR